MKRCLLVIYCYMINHSESQWLRLEPFHFYYDVGGSVGWTQLVVPLVPAETVMYLQLVKVHGFFHKIVSLEA